MHKIFRRLHFYWFTFWVVLVNLLLMPFFFIFSRRPSTYGVLNLFRTYSCKFVLFISALYVRFHYEQKLQKSVTYIFCANHFSNLDVLILCALCNGRYHFMGKQELMDSLFWRIFFTTIDIPVNREHKISAFKAFKKAGENLEKGMSLVIFPEGKIGDPYPPFLHEFKNGPFKLAIDKKIPIVPISIASAWKNMWDSGSTYGTKPGILDVFIHQPIETACWEASDADALKDLVFNKINSKIVSGWK